MKRIIYFIIILFLINTRSYATITNGNIPNVYANTCGPSSNSPCSHNSPIWTDGTNIGINSTTPSQMLDIQGTARMTGFVLTTTPTAGYVLTTNNQGVGTWAAQSSGSGTVNSGTANQVAKYSTTGTAVSGSIILTDTGSNVGINSATPGQALDVIGTVRATAFVGNGSLLTGIGGSISGLTTNQLTKATSATTIGNSIITDTGNIGIGSPAPTNLLEIREQNAFTKVYNYDGVSTYSDDTTQAKITYGTPFTIISSSTQTLYVGSTSKFSGISVALQQPTTSADALIVKYWNGSWSSLTNTDNTNNFQNDGTINFTAPGDWATTAVNSQTLYWVSIQSTTSFSTTPSIYSIRPGIDSVLATFCSTSDTIACLYVNQNGNILAPNISGTQTSVSTPTTIVVGLASSRAGRRVDYMCSGLKDQVCINNAIAACPSAACQIILLEGTYSTTGLVGTSASIKNLTIKGLGANLTLIKPSTNIGAPIISFSGGTNGTPLLNIHIEDLGVDGSNQTKNGTITNKGISMPFCTGCSVRNTYVYNTGATGIALDFSPKAIIVNNVVNDSGTTAQTTGNSCIGNGTGQYADESQVISGNVLENCGFAGILIEAQTIGGELMGNNYNVSGNTIVGNSTYGVVVRGTSNVNITSNIIKGNSSDGVLVSDYGSQSCNNILIESNNINGNGGYGVNVTNANSGGDQTYIQVKNNDLTGNTSGPLNNLLATPSQLTRFNNLGDTLDYIPGNVGIGSVTPSQVLDVSGTVRATNMLIGSQDVCQHNGTNCPSASASAGGGLNAVQYNTSGNIISGNEQVFSFNGTNIGIGTSNGTNLLDVRGSTTTNAIEVNAAGNVGVGSPNPGSALDIIGTLRMPVSGGITIGAATPVNSLESTGGAAIGSYAGVNSAGTGNLIVSGNVSIGTNTSIRQITVIGNGTAAGSEYNNTGSGGRKFDILSTSSSSTIGASGLSFYDSTASIPRMFIDANGNVGIGTLQPANSLAVKAGMSVGPAYATIVSPVGGAIFASNVGIGTSNPGQMLDVNGTTRVNGFVAIGTPTPLNSLDINGNEVIGSSYAGTDQVSTNSLSVQGNIGVGTWIPAAPINIQQNSASQDTMLLLRNANGGTAASSDIDFSTSAGASVIATARIGVLRTNVPINGDTNIYFDITGSSGLIAEKMRLDGNGNLGIGSINPGSSLDVKGTIRASEFSAQSSGTILCVNSQGGIGYCSGVIAGISCTCN